MTSGSVELAAIQQILSQMQIAAALPAARPSSGLQADSFATTLTRARNDLSTAGGGLFIGYLGSGTPTVNGALLPTDGSAAEISQIALLLSTHQSAGLPSTLTSIPTPNTMGSIADGTTGADVVNTALRFEGTPYVWGGSTPRGFDCSGFVQYVYAQLGITVPRTSQVQAVGGTPVASLSNARSGDLIFFAGSDGTAGAPGHVGIYVGNGEMIDAPYTGTSVQVHSVSSAGTIVAIRRVLAGL
ncbi:MAG TPA: NlpC/P60 family protein [Candidatus Paceibacterota bacterium]|nr:NlpC/P60 family protein [Candidatus Paceibacterota bacterium]